MRENERKGNETGSAEHVGGARAHRMPLASADGGTHEREVEKDADEEEERRWRQRRAGEEMM